MPFGELAGALSPLSSPPALSLYLPIDPRFDTAVESGTFQIDVRGEDEAGLLALGRPCASVTRGASEWFEVVASMERVEMRIDRALLDAVRERAAEEGHSEREVVEEAVGRYLRASGHERQDGERRP